MADFQTLKELPAALIEFHKTLPAIEEKTTGVHSSKYAPLSYIQGITVPLLGKQGLVCIQTFESDGESEFLVTHLLHKSGESISGKTKLIKGSMKEPNQDWGAGVTYRSRYAYLKMLGISAGMPDIVDQIETDQPTTSSLKPPVAIPTQNGENIKQPPAEPSFIQTYLLDLEQWAKKHPTLFPGLQVAYKQKFPDFTGSFTAHVQEPHHIEFIDRFTNRLT